MKTNCIHCQLPCKTLGRTECNKYDAIANKTKQLPEKIKEAFKTNNYEFAKKLQEELFRLNHG